MKLFIIVGFICLLSIAFATKQNENEEFPEENVKKYEKNHHHHHHKNHKTAPETFEGKKHAKHAQEPKKEKHIPKSAPHEISPVEAEVQSDISGASHKKLAAEETKHHQEGMHLQDLSYPESSQDATNHHQEEKKKSHQKEKKHHKSGHKKALKEEKGLESQEEKLFSEPNTKEHVPKKHPVLEDSFETLPEEKTHKESRKHAKKQKKAYEKSKKDKHHSKKDKSKKDKSKKDRQNDKKNKKSW